MEFLILGPLEVVESGHPLLLGGAKQRAVLAILLVHHNHVVPTERLIDLLWGDSAPATPSKTLQVYLSQLRKALETANPGSGQMIVTRSPGYMIRVEPGQMDLLRFEELVEEGRRSVEAGSYDPAAEKLREALAVWRGPALADFAYEPFAQTEIAHLEELRMAALELRIGADLALGRHSEIIGELEALTNRHPLRERLRAQLMLALYRSDRQADALRVYRETREVLNEELGIDPGPVLRDLERAILAQDDSLRLVPAGPPPVLRANVTLVAKGGPLEGRRIDIDGEKLIGRQSADVTIDDPELSRRHAIVRPAGDGLEVVDLGSRNGTWVNGERIDAPTRLVPGDVLRLGKSPFEVVPGWGHATVTGETMELKGLLVKEGPARGRRITVHREMVIGREDVDFAIDDEEISRRHAVVRPNGRLLGIKDLGSRNGTWVNGERISPSADLDTGDIVNLGGTVLEVVQERSGITVTRT